MSNETSMRSTDDSRATIEGLAQLFMAREGIRLNSEDSQEAHEDLIV